MLRARAATILGFELGYDTCRCQGNAESLCRVLYRVSVTYLDDLGKNVAVNHCEHVCTGVIAD